VTGPDAVLSCLRAGPNSTRHLEQRTGLSRRQVHRAIDKLRARGYVIENARYAGSHGGGIYQLHNRRCNHAGCITLLSESNPGLYCRRHAAVHDSLLDALIDWLAADVEPVPEMVGQLSIEVYQ
jgi:hypothetical protein